MVNIAYYTHDYNWLGNQMFDINAECNVNDVVERWSALKNYLSEKQIYLNTYDMYANFSEVDIWVMQEPLPDRFKFILRNRINPHKVIFILTEPPINNTWGWKYLRYYSWLFKAFLTWNSELCRNNSKKFIQYHFPVVFDKRMYPYYKSKTKKNLCLMMHSNKSSNVPGELYSLRRNVIEYFDKRGDGLLDLYGHGWNDKTNPHPFFTGLYKGIATNKKEVFSDYYFTFCIDNSMVPGYITYDPLISMSTATVPIYLPMPDSTKYIPEDTFIRYDKFKMLDELVQYLQSIINNNEYETLRENGRTFITSNNYYPFTVEKFCKDIHKAIQALL